jgi:hypothetical protein
VTDLVGYDVIVGQPWLETHDVVKRYSERTITFCSTHCTDYCLQRRLPVQVTCKRNGKSEINTIRPDFVDNICLISA